jgi:hypothetical protein
MPMTVWEIERFKEFLKDKHSYIRDRVKDNANKQIIDLVFQNLFKELEYETVKADEEFIWLSSNAQVYRKSFTKKDLTF